MKLLLLLSAFFYNVDAQGEIVRTCLKGETNMLCKAGKKICQYNNTEYVCPKVCGLCNTAWSKATAVLHKVDCPRKKPLNGKKAYCWEAAWHNDKPYEKKTLVYFYRVTEHVNGKSEVVGYSGLMLNDEEGSIFALGDVEHGVHTVVFGIESKFTDDKRVEYHGKGLILPTFPGLFQAVPATDKVEARSIGLELNEYRGIRRFDNRANITKDGLVVHVQPVLDKRFQENHENDISDMDAYAMGLVEFAAQVFTDSSLEINVNVKVLPTRRYNQNVTTDNRGYSTITSGADRFNFTGHNNDEKNSTIYLFFTETPIADISEGFKLVYSIEGGACQEDEQRVAIIEHFQSAMVAGEMATKAIASLLGVKPDYKNGSNVHPVPRTKDGINCTNVGGFMDARLGANHWTKCSNEDLKDAIKNDTLTCLSKECSDTAFGCEHFKKIHCATSVVAQNCKETCGFCDRHKQPVCEDTNTVCKLGKKVVQEVICGIQPGLCRKSCKLC